MSRFVAAFALSVLLVAPTAAEEWSSDWHPDADGDGVGAGDLCPFVYDPNQADTDGDGTGDACDPDFAQPTPGGAIVDLHAEHVTSVGAWVDFTSPHDTTWGWDAAIAWSTTPGELTTLEGFQAAFDRGDAITVDVEALHGEPVGRPAMITSLDPDTTYELAATRLNWNGLSDAISPVIEIHTLPMPELNLPSVRPRVMTTPAAITALQGIAASGDNNWSAWEAALRPRIEQAVAEPLPETGRHYCSAAAVLALITQLPTDRANALALLDKNIVYWETTVFGTNAYRWEDAQLGRCLDLLWNEIDTATRDRAVTAMLEDDEAHVAEGWPPEGDTDECASTTRTWIIDGLAACEGEGLDPSLGDRACAILDQGLAQWHGRQAVKIRRDRGFWAQSGGFLPDGTGYGQGTTSYWLQTFVALASSGYDITVWAPFLRSMLRSQFLDLLTPRRLGYITAGDVEDVDDNFGIEDNSLPLFGADSGALLLAAGALDEAGDPAAAAWARSFATDVYTVDDSESGVYGLLFGASAMPTSDYRTEVVPTHFDSGSGILIDRTSWSEDASLLFFRGGWSGVHHSQGDMGHFQLYRSGHWITHEAAGYGGVAAQGEGHNVLLLSMPNQDGTPGSPAQTPANLTTGRVTRMSSGAHHTGLVFDATSTYNPNQVPHRYYEAVQRSLVWLKSDEQGTPDVVVVHDLVQPKPTIPGGVTSRWQLHLDSAPALSGAHASLDLPASPLAQRLDVDVLLPADAVLSTAVPEGSPGVYPGEIYTHRLFVDTAMTAVEHDYLVVLQASDLGSGAAVPDLTTSAGFAGAVIGDDLVVLPRTVQALAGGGAASLAATVSTTGALRVFALGLSPSSTYAVTAVQDGNDVQIQAVSGGPIATDAGGLLAVAIAADRSVTPLYQSALFEDGFESGDLGQWSGSVD